MGQTLMARMTNMNRTVQIGISGKKDMGVTSNSSANLASKGTAASMTGTQHKTLMSQTAFGVTSPFKETTARGIVSGMGLLTF